MIHYEKTNLQNSREIKLMTHNQSQIILSRLLIVRFLCFEFLIYEDYELKAFRRIEAIKNVLDNKN